MGVTNKLYTGTLVAETCCVCSVPFGILDSMRAQRLEDHGDFYCPNGHRQHYTRETEAQRLKKQLVREQHRREQVSAELRDLGSAVAPLRGATEEAKAFRGSPRLSAFWKGHEWRGCSPQPTDCPYDTNRGGFRVAWFAGAGLEFVPPLTATEEPPNGE